MLIDLSSQPADRQLRWFAGLWFPAMCLLVGLAARRRGLDGAAFTIWSLGLLLGASGVARPSTIRPVYSVLIWVTFPIGWVLSHAMLLAMYYGVMTPIGWMVRRFHDSMERGFNREARSYWVERTQSPPTRYFRQF